MIRRMQGLHFPFLWEMLVFIISLLGICGLAVLFRQQTDHLSFAPHFVIQARQYLHGHFDITSEIEHDFIIIGNSRYIVYPPGPALLMVPFVALFGSSFNDIAFTWICGAINITLLFYILEVMRQYGWTYRTQRENIIIALAFGFGSIALWLTLGGGVWFTAQTLAVTFLLILIFGSLSGRWWLASIGLAGTLLTRSPDVLAGIFILLAIQQKYSVIQRVGKGWRLKKIPLQTLVGLAIPCLIAIIIWGVRNTFTFGSFFNSGYGLQVQQNYPEIKYGLLSWHYIWPNLVANFLNLPNFIFATPFDTFPRINLLQGGNGISIFFTTPLMLLVLFRQGDTSQQWLRTACWITVALLIGFSLLWNGTGWYQVGSRYLFDAYPFLFLLLALRQERITAYWLALAAFGIGMNIMLAHEFWCPNGACFAGGHDLERWAYRIILALVPLLAGGAWWWLKKSPDQKSVSPSPLESFFAVNE
jgi:hypothetical protein